MSAEHENPLLADWTRDLAEAGIREVTLLSERYEPEHFGNGEARFGWGPIALRLVRERGEDFVELGSLLSPGEAFRWDDLSVAFGWCSLDDLLARTHPITLLEVLPEIVRRASDLQAAWTVQQFESTREAVAAAATRREAAFLVKLRQLAEEGRST